MATFLDMKQRAHHITFIGLSLSLDCGIAFKLTITVWPTLSGKITSHFFLKECRNCWSYKVLKFALESNITKFNPDNAYFSKHMLDAICTFTVDEVLVKKCTDTLYLNRFSNFVGICPKTAPSNG